MPPPIRKMIVAAGIVTLVQAAIQSLLAAFAIAQYFCVIDFLRKYPILIFIRILYFHNPNNCGLSVNIGESIDKIPEQAFVLIQREPFTTTRTFFISCISLGISILWLIGSIMLIRHTGTFRCLNLPALQRVASAEKKRRKKLSCRPFFNQMITILFESGMKRHQSNYSHWAWLLVTLFVSILDLVAIVSYANDSFHTKTLDDIMVYINGTASGIGNAVIDTSFVSWIMVLVYSRFVFLLVNVILMIYAIVDCTHSRSSEPPPEIERNQNSFRDVSEIVSDDTTSSGSMQGTKIPRPGLSQSFRAMKDFLFSRNSHQPGSGRTSLQERNRQGAVNSSEKNQRSLERVSAEQQHRLTVTRIDRAAAPRSPDHTSRRLASSYSFNNPPGTSRGRRDTAAKLQDQMPWSYIPAPANRMRDQLPPDEDLPPVPLPDYTAFQSSRKASVHRAASSLSSINHRKDYTSNQATHRRKKR